ncbi:urease accessory protein UreH [archaeon]|jgi:sulfite exporter TauE/SafE|nr:urease accessory protein UreH [archaeon]|tara:strand:+ start:1249 stop:1935 length:687 start_codon:yes stop_codon:yes gene_type:complete
MELISTYIFTILGFGFLLGLKHALEADHVVAVSTIISQTKNFKKSLVLGASWGIGHTTTLFIIGILILIFKINIPEKFSLSFELIVGIILIGLGIEILYKKLIRREHIHEHKHKNIIHEHKHSHIKSYEHNHNHKSFLLGLVHGLAGSGVLMLLVIASINSIMQGLFFILIFGFGSIIGMLFVSGIIAIPFIFTSKINRLEKILQIIAGSLSILIGIIIITKILPNLF